MSHRTLDDLFARGNTEELKVLVRCDLNVPMKDGAVTDATRIERSAPTLRELAGKGAKVVVLSHFGRPKGTRNPDMSLQPVAAAMSDHLGAPVAFADDCIGPDASAAVDRLSPGGILLLENTRFHAGEEKNEAGLAQQLADLGDAYVNDAFSAAHRAHASTEGVAHLLPAYAGRAMEAELSALAKALETPARPVVAVVGGAKVSTKLDLLANLTPKVDAIVVGGGMANTFLAAQGRPVGKSLCEHDLKETALDILGKAESSACEIVLPVDVVVADALEAGASTDTVSIDQVPADRMILDVGPKSLDDLAQRFSAAATVVWNGPLGAFEVPPFDQGTKVAAAQVAQLTREGKLVSVAGGGDTVAALNAAGAAQDFSYVSTAGGAFLEWLEGKTLPGVQALEAE